ncbi:DUF3021 family protein [Staphylococcus massiliensis]|uniref:DUF3021 domain-containing protein n=1 Tax=Staphylococcus massiliensis S46 TaxID=1229783 RepID=K9ASY8_9STAP|nr:DUF3021 family protein [Staphylococcus massiliensis]EKU45737.1 hypothetical protein C273_10827 [Staphylococcus massiliensis S46]MCG3413482.1 DUF3021 domain-containing protein [Staphylococcus massiliensis]PNZ97679.1 DUF3021 domain-containing protein [Staphylococcus massiliensis CCUG 55927]
MKKILSGSIIGITVGLILSIILSFIKDGSNYYPLSMYSTMGHIYYEHLTEIQVMVLSVFYWAIIGIIFAIGGIIYEKGYALLKSTVLHFILMLVFFFPVAVLAGWFPISLYWILNFLVMYLIVYTIIWIIIYFYHRKIIYDINKTLSSKK